MITVFFFLPNMIKSIFGTKMPCHIPIHNTLALALRTQPQQTFFQAHCLPYWPNAWFWFCYQCVNYYALTHWPLGDLNEIVIFKVISVTDGWSISCKITLLRLSLGLRLSCANPSTCYSSFYLFSSLFFCWETIKICLQVHFLAVANNWNPPSWKTQTNYQWILYTVKSVI